MSRQSGAPRRLTIALILAAAAPAAAVLIIVYFVLAAVMGQNGLLAWGDYKSARVTREAELAKVDAERARLQHRSDLLDPRRGVDPDLADELVRLRTEQVREDEVILQNR
ncbi:FtsB family cell division protein [Sphingomonas montana]|uniref:FtsB family cell division protein n=1 Tax=Sphingomonas montana TaxID=1843236 RepID=UPI00096F23E8|nr:septum formation initiator family protein [Sphingomonas montana]